jgi:hypothetical protein
LQEEVRGSTLCRKTASSSSRRNSSFVFAFNRNSPPARHKNAKAVPRCRTL